MAGNGLEQYRRSLDHGALSQDLRPAIDGRTPRPFADVVRLFTQELVDASEQGRQPVIGIPRAYLENAFRLPILERFRTVWPDLEPTGNSLPPVVLQEFAPEREPEARWEGKVYPFFSETTHWSGVEFPHVDPTPIEINLRRYIGDQNQGRKAIESGIKRGVRRDGGEQAFQRSVDINFDVDQVTGNQKITIRDVDRMRIEGRAPFDTIVDLVFVLSAADRKAYEFRATYEVDDPRQPWNLRAQVYKEFAGSIRDSEDGSTAEAVGEVFPMSREDFLNQFTDPQE